VRARRIFGVLGVLAVQVVVVLYAMFGASLIVTSL